MKNNRSSTVHKDFVFDADDLAVGRILSRREILTLLGTTATATMLAACALPVQDGGPGGPGEAASDLSPLGEMDANLPTGCVVRPELTEGPLFVEEDLNRSDIRLDPSSGEISEGAQLELTFRVTSIADNACTPLSGVQVDLWHCDAFGIYSDTAQLGMNSVGQKFLRGYQVTDDSGIARFTTIYPGWYEGRAVHIHLKMRTGDGYDFTSQLFFDDTLTDTVFAAAPYDSRGERRLRNANDGIYGQSGGQMMLAVDQADTGYQATFDVALDLA
ncbi:MAG: hypothetical protein R2932_34780 [Caldilineaceae bacterium]